jgi:hypothetical protein
MILIIQNAFTGSWFKLFQRNVEQKLEGEENGKAM